MKTAAKKNLTVIRNKAILQKNLEEMESIYRLMSKYAQWLIRFLLFLPLFLAKAKKGAAGNIKISWLLIFITMIKYRER